MAYSDPDQMAYEGPRDLGVLRQAGQAQPMRETLMNRELMILEENVTKLEDVLAQLARRLEPVLNMGEPSSEGNMKETEAVLPELVDRVKRSRTRVSQVARAIIEVEKRLEI